MIVPTPEGECAPRVLINSSMSAILVKFNLFIVFTYMQTIHLTYSVLWPPYMLCDGVRMGIPHLHYLFIHPLLIVQLGEDISLANCRQVFL